MVIAAQGTSAARWPAHWYVAVAWLIGIAAYVAVIWLADDTATALINDAAWTLSSAIAAWACLRTARQLGGSHSTSWWLLGAGCTSWFIGQIFWTYDELILGLQAPVMRPGQVFYTLFPILVIAAFNRLPEPSQGTPFMSKQLGNVALVMCCFMVTIVLGLVEPALQARVTSDYLWLGTGKSALVAATFLHALYMLWTYRWGGRWAVVLKLVVAAGVYAVCNLIYTHSLLTQTYLPGDVVNLSWLVVFGLLTMAATESLWQQRHPRAEPSDRLLSQERWLEAVIPALLIVIMVVVAIGSSRTLTPRVMVWTAVLFILFAIILGAREALIQSDTQRLNSELLMANRRLNEANADLRDSELRYRDLNTELEKRVAERTAQLERAYGELEGFSYAVAHDLKAPLRAINGFAHLLREELGEEIGTEAAAHLRRIRGGALKMSALIDDLLSYANIERRDLHATEVALLPLVRTILDECTDEIQRRNAQLTVEVEALTLFLDADGLALALRNLLGNALKYSSGMPAPVIAIRGALTEEGALLSVSDNGIGFDMQYHDRIFNVFQRLHREDEYPGTGIGLALVRKAVERIGGRTWAQSAVGEGATFFVELPKRVVMQIS